MVQVLFRNLDRSEAFVKVCESRMSRLQEKFPDLLNARVIVTTTLTSSPSHTSSDSFSVSLRIVGGPFSGLILHKEADSIYRAWSDCADHLLERLHRAAEKRRSKDRQSIRQYLRRQMRAFRNATLEVDGDPVAS